jgi:hypothetical protein
MLYKPRQLNANEHGKAHAAAASEGLTDEHLDRPLPNHNTVNDCHTAEAKTILNDEFWESPMYPIQDERYVCSDVSSGLD